MKTFVEWMLAVEAVASDKSLLGYLGYIESDPKEDDIATLISMMRQTRNQRISRAIPQIFARLKSLVPRMPPEKRAGIMSDVEAAEEEIYARAKTPGGQIPYRFDTGSTWRDHDPVQDALSKISGDKDSEFNFTQEVTQYMKDHFGVDLNDFEDDDPILYRAHSIIFNQYDTGVLDTRSAAERVVKFLKKTGVV